MKGSVKKSIVTRVRLAFLGVAVFSGAIFWKATKIQFQEGAKWRALEQERRISYQPVPATRGNIYSDNESIMATSLPFYRVAWDPGVVEDAVFRAGVDSLAWHLSHFFRRPQRAGIPPPADECARAKAPAVRYIRLNSRQINFQEKKLLANWPIFRAKRNRGGAIFEKVDKRFRPFGGLAQRTIGFVNEDKHGAGLEYTFEQSLAGKAGEALFERVPGGVKPVYDGTEIKPLPGYDMKTTLDINLQDVAENALYKSLVDNNAQYGCVILMEVATGEIKAVANLGKASDDTYKEDYNYAFADQGRTEPGSTFKLASMMALFEARPELTLDDMVDTGNGRMYVGGAVKSDSHGYGRITVQQVFEKSSNIGVAKLVDKYFAGNPSEYTDYLKKFGLDKPLGFQMTGEARPYVKDPNDRSWSRTSLTTMSIGYELKLAPLQTLAFYNAVANGGVKVQPMIVQRNQAGRPGAAAQRDQGAEPQNLLRRHAGQGEVDDGRRGAGGHGPQHPAQGLQHCRQNRHGLEIQKRPVHQDVFDQLLRLFPGRQAQVQLHRGGRLAPQRPHLRRRRGRAGVPRGGRQVHGPRPAQPAPAAGQGPPEQEPRAAGARRHAGRAGPGVPEAGPGRQDPGHRRRRVGARRFRHRLPRPHRGPGGEPRAPRPRARCPRPDACATPCSCSKTGACTCAPWARAACASSRCAAGAPIKRGDLITPDAGRIRPAPGGAHRPARARAHRPGRKQAAGARGSRARGKATASPSHGNKAKARPMPPAQPATTPSQTSQARGKQQGSRQARSKPLLKPLRSPSCAG